MQKVIETESLKAWRAKTETRFAALPVGAQQVIKGGCNCPFCKAHPDLIPKWDTLAIGDGRTWTVHNPARDYPHA